jgi:transglutaminase-like putative cysteine protease
MLALLAWPTSSVRARDRAPDWLRALAQEKLPAYPNNPVAVRLLDEEQTIVKDNGDIETLYRRAYKILRPEGTSDYGALKVAFDNETKISSLKAWTITAQGAELEVKQKDAIEYSPWDFAEFSDDRETAVKLPEANPGAVIGYEYVQKNRPFVFEDDWNFQSEIPTVHARFSLQIPSSWEFTTAWANYPEQKEQSPEASTHVWEIHDVPGIEIETDMPPWRAVAGRMDIKYFPSDLALRAKTSGTWNDLGAWYANLTASSRTPTPEIQQKVAALTANLTDPVAKMRALASFVQRQIRYVAIEVGIGGFLPHPAGAVFANEYGDCKDKATLLSTMLKLVGIDSDYVLIHVYRGEVNPKFPSLAFDHVILAIRLPANADTSLLYATVDDPKLGRLLFFDPTNEYVPFGYIPGYLQDNYGLVVTQNGGDLIDLPLASPNTNRLLRTAKFQLDPTGTLTGTVQELRWGGPAADSREEILEASPAKRATFFEDFLGNFLSSFALTHASIGNLNQFDATLMLDYNFVAQNYAQAAGNLLIVRPRILGSKGLFIFTNDDGKPRKYPVQFDETTRQDDVFDITLPAGYVPDELPRPVDADCPYASYKTDVQVTGDVLHYKRTYEVKDVYVPADKLSELRAFFAKIADDERSSAVLRRSQ